MGMESDRRRRRRRDGSFGCKGFDDDDRIFGQRDHRRSSCNDDHDDSIITSDSNTPPMPSKAFAVPSSSSGSSSSSWSSSTPPARFIKHTVSKFDTLAGVAIKYGVEVSDIKRMNSLVTDRQMFALRTLHIPLPGRHPPSTLLSNSPGPSKAEWTPPRRRSDVLETLHSLRVITPEREISSAMCSLQGYYGLKSTYNRTSCDGTCSCLEDGPDMNPPLSLHRKSRSLANGLIMMEDCDLTQDIPPSNHPIRDGGCISKLARLRQKSENGTGGWFSAIAGKGLALRSKAASRINLCYSEADDTGAISFPSYPPGDSSGVDCSSGVRKSCSTSSLQGRENSSSLSIFSASKWSLKPDLQALSTLAVARPILDGLSKPIARRKSKAALD